MAINSTTKLKYSGILRYSFGGGQPFNPTPQRAVIVGGDPAVILVCCGADADLDVDMDNQVFGASAGHAAITGSAFTFFSGSNVVARDMQQVGEAGTAYAGFHRSTGYIPVGTKVHAYFQITNAVVGLSTARAEEPLIAVQTEVISNRRRRNGVEDTTGPQFLGSIRVALMNLGAVTSSAAGVLIVELQHSEHDIPGADVQNQNWSTDGLS